METSYRFNLRDSTLYYLNTTKYQNSLVSDRQPSFFEWVNTSEDLPSFYTYKSLENLGNDSEKNVILLESSAIIPDYVKWVSKNSSLFNKIYTHNSDLLRACDNTRWIPGGGVWIGTEFGGGQMKIYEKERLCSFFTTDKIMCSMHRMRHDCWRMIKNSSQIKFRQVDLYESVPNLFIKPIDYLGEYRFSVIFENYQDDLYFTEKILNCFATGTIPIYMGAKNIGTLFDDKGIIKFSKPKELFDILMNITESDYLEKLDAVKKNFEICKKFVCIEDYMWEHYLREEYENRHRSA